MTLLQALTKSGALLAPVRTRLKNTDAGAASTLALMPTRASICPTAWHTCASAM